MSRKPKFTNEDVFALAAELFYQPDLSLERLSKIFQRSTASIKRIVKVLKQCNIMHGKLGSSSVWLNLRLLPNLPLSFCSAVVNVERDVEQLKAMARGKSQHYDAAKELLTRLCSELPRKDGYKGRIIVETGGIVMPKLDFLIVVHGVTWSDLNEFVRFGVNGTKGIRSSEILVVTYSVSGQMPREQS